MNTPNTRAEIAAATGASPADFVIPPLAVRLQRYEDELAAPNPHYTAACLLSSSLEPLLERDDDADVTLPAQELQALLQALHGQIYDQQVSLRCLVAELRASAGITRVKDPIVWWARAREYGDFTDSDPEGLHDAECSFTRRQLALYLDAMGLEVRP